MTRTNFARLCSRIEALVALVAVPTPIGVAFAAAWPGLVRATRSGAVS